MQQMETKRQIHLHLGTFQFEYGFSAQYYNRTIIPHFIFGPPIEQWCTADDVSRCIIACVICTVVSCCSCGERGVF